MKWPRGVWWACCCSLLAALVALSTRAATIEGSAAYRERIAAPPDAVFEARLEDVSRADAPATVLGRHRIEAAGNPPYRFRIEVPDEALRPGARYAVRATLSQQDRLLFTTDTAHLVQPGQSAPLVLTMVSARGGGEPRITTSGMFRYLADAPSIELCADGQRLPVAQEGDYLALERAYLAAGANPPGSPLLVTLEGTIAPRAVGEQGSPPRNAFVVERFGRVWPCETCGQPMATSPLRNTYWKLARLNGEPATVGQRQREPHLIFNAKEPRVAGSGGCNRIMGGFELDADKLSFSRMAGTMMACPEGMAQEKALLDALGQVRHWQVRGSHLELMDAQRKVLARFEAVALK